MAKKRRRFTARFKKRVALEALREREKIQEIAARHQVQPSQVTAWKRKGLEDVFSGSGSKRAADHEATIRELHAKIGELTVERDFFFAGWSTEAFAAGGDDRAHRSVVVVAVNAEVIFPSSAEVNFPIFSYLVILFRCFFEAGHGVVWAWSWPRRGAAAGCRERAWRVL